MAMSLTGRLTDWLTGPAAPEDRATHATWLTIALLFSLAPFALRPGVAPADGVRFGSRSIPAVCMSKKVFDVDCPGCGLTRAFVLVAHGRFRESFTVHRVGMPMYAFMVWQIAVRSMGVWKPLRPVVGFEAAVQRIFPTLIIVLLVGNWVIGLMGI